MQKDPEDNAQNTPEKGSKLSTEAYKGVRDFYPEDMAVQRYIFEQWAKTAESFGFERYDASVLEPSELYKAKGAENEEIVNEQTYTFIDKGDREVTLRPEMTPTVARMVAGKRRELTFPLRWYSIPNLFRYERPQRGRVREHWQLNADIFGSHSVNADVEIILLASAILKGFGAKDSDFEIKINSRVVQNALYAKYALSAEQIRKTTAIIDRKMKMSHEEFATALAEVAGPNFKLPETEPDEIKTIRTQLASLGVTNTKYDASIVRGFAYYTGTIFEIFDTHENNRRSLLGGGRYDNLTGLFLPAGQAGGGDPIPAVGFGMGDVTMRDFLETHNLLPSDLQSIDMAIIPLTQERVLDAVKVAQVFRKDYRMRVYVSLADKKVGEQIAQAVAHHAKYIIVVGDNELKNEVYTLKRLADGTEKTGAIPELYDFIFMYETHSRNYKE